MARPLTSRTSRTTRLVAGAAAAATGMAVIPALFASGTAVASSHREAPYIAGDPRADNTDVYAFVSPDDPDSVTFIANWLPFQDPNGGPNFYPFADDVAHDIEIDNDGDAVVDIVYRWIFSSEFTNPDTFLYNNGPVTSLDDENLNFQQTYTLQVKRGALPFVDVVTDAPVAPSNVGPASMPDYAGLRAEAVQALPGGGQSFAGQADDPFFLDLRVFDLLYGADFSKAGLDTLNGYNVNSIALKVPKTEVAALGLPDANPVIGVFSTTSRRTTRVFNTDGSVTESGDFAQVSRLGSPLVNEVVVPVGLKDAFNNSRPEGDGDFLGLVNDPELARLVEGIYMVPAPDTDPETEGTQRADLVQVFLTGVDGLTTPELNAVAATTDIAPSEMLRLNMSVEPTATPQRLGVLAGDTAGFPNGRRLTDDVLDIALQAVEGVLLGGEQAATAATLGDGVGANDVLFSSEFPYVALPHDSSVNASQFTTFNRIEGSTRYATAAAASRAAFETADSAIVVNGDDVAFPDALAANFLAGAREVPILLTTRDSSPAATVTELQRLGVEDITIVGGESRVSAAQAAALDAAFGTVDRVSGADRFATARAVAEEAGADAVGDGTAIIATGTQFADALVAGPLAFANGFPILLSGPDGLSPQTLATLDALGITKALVTGGTTAVPATVDVDLVAADIAVTRLSGADRRATAVAIATFARDELGFDPTVVTLARGDVPADALAGGPLAGLERSVILLTAGTAGLGNATSAYLADQSVSLESGRVLGGPVAVSSAVVAAATDAANSDD